MFILSPAGYVIQVEQDTPLSLIGRESKPSTVAKNLPGQRFDTEAPGKYDISFLTGESVTIDCQFETGSFGGLPKYLFDIWGGPAAPNAHVRAWVTNINHLSLLITDKDGGTVATCQLPGFDIIPEGQLVRFRFGWSNDGKIPQQLQSNWNAAYLNVNGTNCDWAVSAPLWDAWRPNFILVGGDFVSPHAFNGIIRRVAISDLENPDALSTTPLTPPRLLEARISHAGDLTVTGSCLFSEPSYVTNVVLTGAGAVTVGQAAILAAGGRVGSDVFVPVALVPGIDDTTNCQIFANTLASNIIGCLLPSDMPTITSALIGLSGSLSVVGTFLLSRGAYPDTIQVFGPGAVVLTKLQVTTAGGTWTDTNILIPVALVPGINGTSTCAVTADAHTSAVHVMFAAPTVSAANIAHLGDVTITGTGMLSTAPASNSVTYTLGGAAVVLTAAAILAAGGSFGMTSIVVPAALVLGASNLASMVVHSNSQDSNVRMCTLPSDVPTVSSAIIGFDSGLVLSGTNLLSRVPNVSSIDIQDPGAVSLTRSDVETGGGTWTDTDISIPAALVPGIANSTCAVTANAQVSVGWTVIQWPAPAPVISAADIAHLGDLTITGTGMLSTAPAANSVILTGAGAVTLSALDVTTGGGTVTATSIVIPAALVPGIDGTSSAKVNANLQNSNVVVCSEPLPDAPFVTPRVALGLPAAVIVTPDLNLDIVGGNFLSRTPNVSSIDIADPGAVSLTRAVVVAAAGGVWTDDHILIPVALVPSIDNTSTYTITSNIQTTVSNPIGGPSSIDPPS